MCKIYKNDMIDRYFFKNDAGNIVTVNGTYVTKFLWPELNDIDLEDVWFQQDSVSSHFAKATIDVLREKFRRRVILRNGDVKGSPKLCDLTPLDFFL